MVNYHRAERTFSRNWVNIKCQLYFSVDHCIKRRVAHCLLGRSSVHRIITNMFSTGFFAFSHRLAPYSQLFNGNANNGNFWLIEMLQQFLGVHFNWRALLSIICLLRLLPSCDILFILCLLLTSTISLNSQHVSALSSLMAHIEGDLWFAWYKDGSQYLLLVHHLVSPLLWFLCTWILPEWRYPHFTPWCLPYGCCWDLWEYKKIGITRQAVYPHVLKSRSRHH